jgi:hypothetical protein
MQTRIPTFSEKKELEKRGFLVKENFTFLDLVKSSFYICILLGLTTLIVYGLGSLLVTLLGSFFGDSFMDF